MLTPKLFTTVISHYLPPDHASLLNGIVFGVNFNHHSPLYREFQTVGLLHLVVLSGMNITILLTLAGFCTHRLGRNINILLLVLILIFFITFVGVQAPVIRAGFMSVLTFVSIVTGRRTHTLIILLFSAVLSLLIWPSWITSFSFYLSYAATVGLILFSPKEQPINETKSFFQTIKSNFILEIKVSLAAQVFTVPLIWYYFKQISLISPLANALVAWTVSPIMIFGILAAILGKISFALGIIPAYLAYGLLQYVLVMVHFLSKIPYASINF